MNDQWKRFAKVYLNELLQDHINRKEKYSKSNLLNVGDIVLINGQENVPRTQWHIGKANKSLERMPKLEVQSSWLHQKPRKKQYVNVQYKN